MFGKQFLIPPSSVVDDKTFPNATQFPYASEEPYSNHTPDHVFPVFTVIELICFLGWVKVAECLLNPYGGKYSWKWHYLKMHQERNPLAKICKLRLKFLFFSDDDEDFNISYLINRNLEVIYLIIHRN